MNQQSTPHWLRLCTLGLSLFIGSTSLAAPPQPTADDLYVQGSELFIKGRILEAREVLLRADLTQLERAKRQDLLRMVNQIDEQIGKMPESQVRLEKAQLAIARQDYRTATSHLETVKKSEASNAEQKKQAADLLAQVRTSQKELAPQITMVLQKAMAAFDAGNYGEAKAGLNFVYNSGVALDLDQQKDLSTYITQITTLEAQQGRFVTPAVNVGVMQDQPPQEEPAQEPSEQPAQEPTEQPAQQPPSDNNQTNDLIYQAQQAQAQINIEQARQAFANGQYAAAAELYQKVLAVQPDNAEAQKGLNDSRAMLNRESILPDVGQTRQIQHDQLVAEYNNLMEQARLKMTQGDFTGATDYVSQAKIRIDEGRAVLAPQEREALRSGAIDLAEQIETARREAHTKEIEDRTAQITRDRIKQQQEIEMRRQQQNAQRLLEIRKLQLQQRYEEALLETNTLLFDDPGNPAGLALKSVLEDLRGQRRWDRLQRDQNLRAQNNRNELLEQSLIPKDIVEYPPDWPELSLRRSDFAFNDSEADRRVWNALARQRANVDFHGTPLGDVVKWIGEVANVNVDVDWKALEQNFIDRNMPINLRLNDQVNLQVVLERTLAQLGDAHNAPQYAVQDGILTISTKEKLAASPIIHVYDIGDLLVDVPHFDNAPTFDLDKAIERRTSNRDSLKASLFGSDEVEKYDRGRNKREQLLEQIRDILTTTIDSSSWQVNGGEVGSIQALNSNLIITTTAKNHRDISNLLSKLREIRNIQINVDSRFLIVNEDFFEQVGIDLDIYFGGSEYSRASRLDPNLLPIDMFRNLQTGEIDPRFQRQYSSPLNFTPNGTIMNNREQFDLTYPQIIDADRRVWSPSSVQNNTLDIARSIFGAPGDSVAADIIAGNPAFTYGVSFLNDLQVDLLIEATQADRRNIQLTSPKLTFFNGQRAFTQVTTSRFFVSDLQPVVGDSSAGFDPTLQAATEGVVLDVEGTVSADRRYVTMTVQTSLSDIIDIQSSSLPIVVGGQVLNSGDPNDILSQTAEIQRPITQVSAVNTTVSVPDRGTIMLGGQTIRNDIQVETGVPVLSKIPIINRFFTNRIDSVEEKTLLILIKPTIIIQQENEQTLFPGLEDSLRNGFTNSY